MASYFYLISSLPMLRVGSPMPFSYEKFLNMCQGNVDQDTYSLLENLTVNSKEGPLIEEWSKFYGILFSEMNYQRNLRLQKSCSQPSERDELTSKTVAAALNAANPLEAELMLLSLEFSKLDDLIGMHSFDDYTLFGYALKLKLLQRQTVYDKDIGNTEFKRIFEVVEQKILNI